MSVRERSGPVAASLLVLWIAACGAPARAPIATSAPPRDETRAELLARARVDLGCERAALVDLAPRHVAAAGCSAQREYRRVCDVSQGCAWIAIDDLVIRASFELDCPVSDLEVVTLGASSRGVIGCGVRATYVLVCPGEGCHWLPSSLDRTPLDRARQLAPASLRSSAVSVPLVTSEDATLSPE